MSFQQLSNIGQLEKLQALRLSGATFDDDKWEVSNDEFPQLRLLELYECNHLKEWSVADDAFPNLERLVLDNCCSLKEIPSCFRDIYSLKSIEVRDCVKSVEKSASDIRETQVEDYQNSDFKLFIKEGRSHIKGNSTGQTYSDISLLSNVDEDDYHVEEDDNNDDDEEVEKRKTYFRSFLDWLFCKN